MPAGAARNAVGALCGITTGEIQQRVRLEVRRSTCPKPVTNAFTLSLDT
jgi:hypothetical protein